MDCSLLGSSVHGTSQARILEWVAIPFSRGSITPLPASGTPPEVSGARQPVPSTLCFSLLSWRKMLRQRFDSGRRTGGRLWAGQGWRGWVGRMVGGSRAGGWAARPRPWCFPRLFTKDGHAAGGGGHLHSGREHHFPWFQSMDTHWRQRGSSAGRRSPNADSSSRWDRWSTGLSVELERQKRRWRGWLHSGDRPAKSRSTAHFWGAEGVSLRHLGHCPVGSLRRTLGFRGHWPSIPAWPAHQLQYGGPHVWPRVHLKVLHGEGVFWWCERNLTEMTVQGLHSQDHPRLCHVLSWAWPQPQRESQSARVTTGARLALGVCGNPGQLGAYRLGPARRTAQARHPRTCRGFTQTVVSRGEKASQLLPIQAWPWGWAVLESLS